MGSVAIFCAYFGSGEFFVLNDIRGVSNLNFNYMDAYVIMITYFLRKMGETKTSCKQFVAAYQQQTEYLRNELPIGVCNQILGTQHRSNINTLQKFISKS